MDKNEKGTNIKNKKAKLSFRKLFKNLLIIFIIFIVIYMILNLRIKNIFVSGNEFLSDQEVIEIAGISNYPKIIFNSFNLKSRLNRSEYISSADIKFDVKRGVHINICENKPLFYSDYNKKTVLSDLSMTDRKFDVAVLVNYVPDTIYNNFIKNFSSLSSDVFMRISEIKYAPNEVDDSLFILTMNDGNYVYITINKMDSLNRYVSMVQKFNNKKGILYLDSGEYFKILED